MALKLGERSAALLRGRQITISEASGALPVDNAGAGDAFDAGFTRMGAGQPP